MDHAAEAAYNLCCGNLFLFSVSVRRFRQLTGTMQCLIITAIVLAVTLVNRMKAEAAAPKEPAQSLKDIEHVIIFMQENRSWDTVRSLPLRSLC